MNQIPYIGEITIAICGSFVLASVYRSHHGDYQRATWLLLWALFWLVLFVSFSTFSGLATA